MTPTTLEESNHCINVLNPERHGGDGLNNSYISYDITSHFVIDAIIKQLCV